MLWLFGVTSACCRNITFYLKIVTWRTVSLSAHVQTLVITSFHLVGLHVSLDKKNLLNWCFSESVIVTLIFYFIESLNIKIYQRQVAPPYVPLSIRFVIRFVGIGFVWCFIHFIKCVAERILFSSGPSSQHCSHEYILF